MTDIETLKKATQYLKEYYLTAKMTNPSIVLGGLDQLNEVILKMQELTEKERSNEDS